MTVLELINTVLTEPRAFYPVRTQGDLHLSWSGWKTNHEDTTLYAQWVLYSGAQGRGVAACSPGCTQIYKPGDRFDLNNHNNEPFLQFEQLEHLLRTGGERAVLEAAAYVKRRTYERLIAEAVKHFDLSSLPEIHVLDRARVEDAVERYLEGGQGA